MITHKFREVMAYADDVSVLRRGPSSPPAPWPTTRPRAWRTRWSAKAIRPPTSSAASLREAAREPGTVKLEIESLDVMGDRGEPAVRVPVFERAAREIVGIAGVSGNGQRELMQARWANAHGSRAASAWTARLPRPPGRERARRCGAARGAAGQCLRRPLSVAQNMALRSFDELPWARGGLVRWAPCGSGPAPGSPSTASRPRASARPSARSRRQCAARRAGARAGWRGGAAAGQQPRLRARLRGRGRDSRPPDGRRNRGAAVLLVSETWTSCCSWPTASS